MTITQAAMYVEERCFNISTRPFQMFQKPLAFAVSPLFGLAGGALRMIFGTIQTLGALLALFLLAPAAISKRGQDLILTSVEHLVNGMGNIVRGVVEATPVLGGVWTQHRMNYSPFEGFSHGATCITYGVTSAV